jgi:hypothetical protein
MNRFEGKVTGLKSVFTGLSGTIAGAFTGGLAIAGIDAMISRLFDFTNQTIEATRQFDNLKSSIEFASGTDDTKNIEFLDKQLIDLDSI